MKQTLKVTNDGSHTLYVPELDEHYHSVNGAYNESMHVFIHKGLHAVQKNAITVFEVGFGTGLNALLTAIEAEKLHKKIHYISIEKYPIDPMVVEQLNYSSLTNIPEELLHKLHASAWGKRGEINQHLDLTKIKTDINSFQMTEETDLIYFDAFAPDKQPKMWTELVFEKMYHLLTNQGILVTYCAKGAVRRTMQKVGFEVERIDGPPGKREMLRAWKK